MRKAYAALTLVVLPRTVRVVMTLLQLKSSPPIKERALAFLVETFAYRPVVMQRLHSLFLITDPEQSLLCSRIQMDLDNFRAGIQSMMQEADQDRAQEASSQLPTTNPHVMPTPGFLPSDTALEAKAATLDEIGEARAASGPAESLGQRVEQPATLEQWAPSEGFERLSGTPGTEGQDVGASSEGRDVGAGAALPQSAAAGAAVTGKHSAGAKKAPAEEAGAPDARSPEAIAALLAERAAMASAMPLSQPLSPASHARAGDRGGRAITTARPPAAGAAAGDAARDAAGAAGEAIVGWARKRLRKRGSMCARKSFWGQRGYHRLVSCADIIQGWEQLCYAEEGNADLEARNLLAAQLQMLSNRGVDLAVVEVLRLPISRADVAGVKSKAGQAAFALLGHAVKILAALAKLGAPASKRLMNEETLFWSYFATPGVRVSTLLLALVQNNMERVLKVGPDWITRIFEHAVRDGHRLRVGWVRLLTALVVCGRQDIREHQCLVVRALQALPRDMIGDLVLLD
ncbi:hypothetical protein T484DRAFT_1877483, partial [Baffinella frigidus]